METPEINDTVWQAEIAGNTREASLDQIAAWIADGSLLRIDRVRKGNLRWIEAGKVPNLAEFFNAKDSDVPLTAVVTTSSGQLNIEDLGPKTIPVSRVVEQVRARPALQAEPTSAAPAAACALHSDVPAAFICETCENSFCKTCPSSYGGTVKICPFCGAMCKPLVAVQAAKVETELRTHHFAEGFGFGDFAEALKYPFRFKTSLILGALMFAFFSLGQGVASFGGAFMISAAIMCFMLANMLSFGVLANVVENFSQGKTAGNFMPSFEDFNLWDDVVHPFFLSIGVYIVSFGPLIAAAIVAFFLIAGAAKPASEPITSAVAPDVSLAAKSVEQSQQVKELIGEQNAKQKQRVEEMTDAAKLADSQTNDAARQTSAPVDEEKHFQDLQNQINQARKNELESTFGKAPETKAAEQRAMISSVLKYGVVFLLVGGVCLLWALFYLPAACCVAGYTRSFGATLNPSVGIDTIRRLGSDYAKLLFFGFLIVVMSGVVSGVLAAAFSPFALPDVGNLPANFIGSLFTFYLSVVFSVTLGLAVYKASDRLQLFKG